MPSKLPFLAALLLLSVLLMAASAGHAAPGAPAAPLSFEEEAEAEEEEEEEEWCDEAIYGPEAAEEGCEEAEPEGPVFGSTPPEECLLRSASARAVVDRKRRTLKVTVGYTTYEPTSATIEIRKGSVRIGSVKRRLGRSGVIRIAKKLNKRHGARRIVVRIHVPSVPSGCARYETRKLTVR